MLGDLFERGKNQLFDRFGVVGTGTLQAADEGGFAAIVIKSAQRRRGTTQAAGLQRVAQRRTAVIQKNIAE